MPTDVYGAKSATFGGAFAADDALITFSQLEGADGQNLGAIVPLLVQSLQVSYAQSITRLYNIASNDIYLVRGRASGNCQLGEVVGPARLSSAFLTSYGDVCRAYKNNLDITLIDSQCSGAGNSSGFQRSPNSGYTAKYCVIEQLGLQVTAEQMVIQRQLSMQISALEEGLSAGARGLSQVFGNPSVIPTFTPAP